MKLLKNLTVGGVDDLFTTQTITLEGGTNIATCTMITFVIAGIVTDTTRCLGIHRNNLPLSYYSIAPNFHDPKIS